MNSTTEPKPISKVLVNSIAILMAVSGTCFAQDGFDGMYIPADAIAATIINPNALISSYPQSEYFPHEIVKAWGEQQLGFDPLLCSQAIILAGNVNKDHPPVFGAIFRFAEPVAFGGEFLLEFTKEKHKEHAYYRLGREEDPSVLVVDDQTLLVGTYDWPIRMLDANQNDSKLLQLIVDRGTTECLDVYVAFDEMRELLNAEVASMEGLPPQFEQLKELPDLIRDLSLHQEFNNHLTSKLIVRAVGESEATRAHEIFSEAIRNGKELLIQEMANEMNVADPVQKATIDYIRRVASWFENKLQPETQGNKLVYEADQGIASIPLLTALLLPAVQATRGAARRTDTMNKMRQLMLATHNFHDSMKRFPTNHTDREGTPLLSWRVQILPFIEQNVLYDQFNLDEPWDSEHNIQLISQMPDLFRSLEVDVEAGKTIFQGVSGEEYGFNNKRLAFAQIQDGSSRTVALVEVDPENAVIWTRPDDWKPNGDNPLEGLATFRPQGFIAALFDGSVQLVDPSIDVKAWKAMLTIRGGD